MPISLSQLVRDSIRSVTTEEGREPDRAECHEVADVAKAGPAGAAGVEVGDLLVTVQDRPASSVAPELDGGIAEAERRYLFWSPRTRRATRLVTTGISPGLELRRTVASVLRDFESRPSPYDLEIVWRAGEWKALEELSRFFMTGSRKPPGLLRKVLGIGNPASRATPALMFLGAALVEQGSVAEGMKMIQEYLEQHAQSWTLNFVGIAQFYVGLACLASDEGEDGLAYLWEAWSHTEEARVADVIEQATGSRPAKEAQGAWVGKELPEAYQCEPLEKGGKGASFATSVRSLPEGKLLVVCLLGQYRINGPYNDAMQRYRNFGRHLAPYLHELHVITENPQRVPDEYAHFLEGEKGVLADGLAATIALDRGGDVGRAIEPDASPCFLLVDGQRTVQLQGMLETVALWETLARLHP